MLKVAQDAIQDPHCPALEETRTVGHHHAAGCPEVHGLSESARSKNMVAAPYPPADQAISCLQAAGLAQSLPGGVCLLLKAIGASEGWRNAIRYYTRSVSQPAMRIPPLVVCQSPKIANWPPP